MEGGNCIKVLLKGAIYIVGGSIEGGSIVEGNIVEGNIERGSCRQY